MKVFDIKITELKPYEKNNRIHPKKQVDLLARNITKFGFTTPILIDENNNIIAGHGRLLALKQLNATEAPCVRIEGLTNEEVKALRLADNQIASLGEYDMSLVIEELKGLSPELLDLTGFDKDLIIESDEADDLVPEIPEVPQSKLGDLYELGQHRVLCGDSTKIEDVEKLMDGKKADMVFTDPPYNIDFKGTLSCTSKDGKIVTMKAGYKVPNAQYGEIKNDKVNKEDFNSFISSILLVIKEHCVGGWYICFSSSTLNELLVPLIETEMKWKSIIIWNKNQPPSCVYIML